MKPKNARLSLVSAAAIRHIPLADGRLPLKRARKQGVGLTDDRIIAFPYIPRVADPPPGWRHLWAAQKIEYLIGLDRGYQILFVGPIIELDQLRRSFQWQVMRVLWSIGIKATLDGTLAREAARERERQHVIEELDRKLRERAEQTARTNGATP